uniref:Ig-like domain-containing protein n=1 Tax=Astyanax mexicanus TaxID=7994 RepID=W5LGL6_ASTMX
RFYLEKPVLHCVFKCFQLYFPVTLPTPRISLSTTNQVTWGERVDITCSVETQHTGGSFNLKKGSGSVIQTKSGTSVTFSFPKVDFANAGSYYCQYQTRVSSREFSSPLSSSVYFTVIVTVPTPRISLSPTKEISWGERVNITCSVETQFREGSFTLTQSSGSLRETKRGTSVTFSFLKVDFIHEGSYYCQYKTRVSSRDFSSPQSSSVKFLVVVNLLQPNISFSAPDGGSHWGPQGLEVTRGYSFSIICSTQPQYRGGSFYLEFSGSNITSTNQPAVNHSATFFFHEADYDHQGNYSCVYEVTVSSRTFRSSNIELLGITVKASLAPFIGSGVGMGLLLILVPILIFIIWRCKRQKRQMDAKMVYKQRAVNTYDTSHGMNEMEEDEEDYENADVFQNNKDSNDSDDDYISIDEKVDKKPRTTVDNDYSGPHEMSFAGNELEEDEDDDYENVCMSEEGGVDMHADGEKCWLDSEFEDEDIYANVE